MQATYQQKHARHYIGSSNVPGILGVSPYRTPLDEYHVIIGDSPEINESTRRFFDRRKSLEPFVAQVLRADMGEEITSQNERYTDAEFDFLRAEIDAENSMRNFEFKTVHPNAAKDWGTREDAQAPTHVIAQATFGHMIHPKADGVVIVGQVGFDSQRRIPLQIDEELQALIRGEMIQFWNKHIVPMIAPEPTTVGDILTYVKADPTKVLDISGDAALQDAVKAFAEAKQEVKAAEEKEEALKTRIQLALVERTSIVCNGKVLLTWTEQKSSRLDTGAFRAAHPDIAAAFSKDSISRVMRLKK